MSARLVADIILISHLAFILFVIFGGLLVFYRRWLAWVHIPLALWGAMVNLAGWVCPLTPLENKYRSAAGQAGYARGFVEHYIAPLVYPEGLTHELGMVVGISVLVWNILLYGFICYRLSIRKRYDY